MCFDLNFNEFCSYAGIRSGNGFNFVRHQAIPEPILAKILSDKWSH